MRYPVDALLEVSGLSMGQLANRLRLNTRDRNRVTAEGLSELVADRWATRLGLHPAEVWPEWLDAAKVECANDRCTARFLPTRKGHIYCLPRCQDAARKRRRYADPVYRARKQEYLRDYRQEAAKAIRAGKRAWNEANRERVREANREANRRHRAALREAA